jgi:hypothetical protein
MTKQIGIILIVFFTGSLTAQHVGLYFGLNAAYQYTRILNSDDDAINGLSYENTLRYAYGVDLGYKFDTLMGIQTGFIYSEEGQQYLTKTIRGARYKTELSYYKIPVLFGYQLFLNPKFSILTQGGFQLSILKEAGSSRNKVYGEYNAVFTDVKDYYETLPIEAVLALGLQFHYKRLSLNLMLRTDYSLSDIEVTEKKPGLRPPTSNFTLAIPLLGFHYFFK